jgi:hypothetical protein
MSFETLFIITGSAFWLMTVGMPYKRGAKRQWPTVEEMKASAVTNFISLLYFLGFSGFAAIPLIKPIIKNTIETVMEGTKFDRGGAVVPLTGGEKLKVLVMDAAIGIPAVILLAAGAVYVKLSQVEFGLGRIVVLYRRSSTSYQIH